LFSENDTVRSYAQAQDKRRSIMENNNPQDGVTSETLRSPEISHAEGRDLKTIREAHGITLQDIFQTTRVTVVNLGAIESGNYSLLPPPFIAKSFIQAYARAVGVDAEAIIGDYEQFLKKASQPMVSPSRIFGRGKVGSSI